MLIKTKTKQLITGVICTLFSSATVFAAQNTAPKSPSYSSPPEATAEEAKIRHWSVPDIEKEFWDISELDTPYISISPVKRNDGISVAELEISAENQHKLLDLAKEIADKKHAEVDSLLIAHKGKLVFESYFARGRVDLSHPQSSTTKSYTALALGRAIALGHLSMADLNKPVTALIKGLQSSEFAPGADEITLHQLLTMSSGLAISDEKMQEYRKSPQQYQGMKQIQAYFEDSAPVTAKSKHFSYQGPNPNIVMHVLNAVVPGSAEEFIKTQLLGKLDIVNYDWRLDPSGLPASGSFSSMTSRNMIKLGNLVMNKGKWRGEQLIPEAFIEIASNTLVPLTTEQTNNFYTGDKLSNSGYGYFWWQTDLKVGSEVYHSRSAQGGGGVAIVLIDELDLVIVVTAHARQAYLQMIAEKVLPAFVN